ncbi:hypothetical protein F9B74_01570 [Pelistega sp. NLN82]|uniref:Uncharacterized protein n=2 Tax=Pelistega ratti TaxID=2652177 RepID=A0A6L9Y5D1_9BURK|nr:hypothetical protein [Pelistega ratti]
MMISKVLEAIAQLGEWISNRLSDWMGAREEKRRFNELLKNQSTMAELCITKNNSVLSRDKSSSIGREKRRLEDLSKEELVAIIRKMV